MGTSVETLLSELTPLLEAAGLGIYDVELGKGIVRVTVTRPAGVGIDELTQANNIISSYLDDHEPFERRYTLEVTSPGVERPLRTPAHFAAAIGESIKAKVSADLVADRRVDGTILSSDGTGILLEVGANEPLRIAYDQIERARTTYNWGPAPKPSPSRGGATRPKGRSPKSTQERITTP